MTPAKAKVIFATHMQAARKRRLTSYELNQLSTARQVLRQNRKPAMNAPHKKGKKSQCNPRGVLIYGNVQRIYATKTQPHICDDDCKAHEHRYYHEFTTKPKMYGLPDGSILIKS